jgi:transposase-like protein
MLIKFDVEFEITPIRFVYVTCPKCNNKFDGRNYGETESGSCLHDKVDLMFAKFICPHCAYKFETRGQEIEINSK